MDIRKLKRAIRMAVERPESETRLSMVELRDVLEDIIADVYQHSETRLPAGRGDPEIYKQKAKMGKKLEEAGVLPKELAECARIAGDSLNNALHKREVKPTASDIVLPLKNLLRVLKWYERECPATATGESAGETARPGDKEGPYTGATVVLAGKDAGSDIEKEWDEIRTSLANDGAAVVSDEAYLSDRSQLDNALCVQLFGTLDRWDGAKVQLEKCGLKAGSDHLLQWRKALPNPRIDAEIVESLEEEDRRFCDHARTGSFEEFKMAVRDKLRELMKPAEEIPMWGKPYLYITADRSNKTDDDHAGRFQDAACKYVNADVMRKGKEGQQRSDFKHALKKGASGIVFLYGDTQPEFIENWLSFFKREMAGMRMKSYPKMLQLNLKLAALYEAPPEGEEKKQIKPRKGMTEKELPTFGSREAFSLGDVAEICKRLLR